MSEKTKPDAYAEMVKQNFEQDFRMDGYYEDDDGAFPDFVWIVVKVVTIYIVSPIIASLVLVIGLKVPVLTVFIHLFDPEHQQDFSLFLELVAGFVMILMLFLVVRLFKDVLADYGKIYFGWIKIDWIKTKLILIKKRWQTTRIE